VSTEDKARVANIFDVARLAGVSHQTVSRVLNDLPNVRPATRERVEDAIKQLRYRPSTAARSLVTRRSRTIGLITTGNPDYGPSSILLGFTEAARNARYLVSISSMLETDVASMRAAVELLLSQSVEAIVLIAAHRGALEAIQGIDLGVPLIAVESSGRVGFHSVSIDQFRGAYDATSHLIALGHRSIAHVAGPEDSMDATERVRGWQAALSEHGLVAHEPLQGDWSPASGFACGLQLDREYTAVFSANDQMALGVMHAFGTRGIRVPQDVSVIGFDDIPEAEHFTPPLSTVRPSSEKSCRTVMSTLLEVILDESLEEAPHPVPVLVPRESTAPPRE
jgi:DNA-binding LacI/PurR family transcriptional regulator